MKLLLDENLSYRICSHLRTAGHDAVHVGEVELASTDDRTIMARARDESRVIVSCDHDFVQMLFATGDTYPSLLLTRNIDTLPSARIASLLVAALSFELQELLAAGAIATVTPNRVRVQPLPLRATSDD